MKKRDEQKLLSLKIAELKTQVDAELANYKNALGKEKSADKKRKIQLQIRKLEGNIMELQIKLNALNN